MQSMVEIHKVILVDFLLVGLADILPFWYFWFGDILFQRGFGMETFCKGDILCGDVLYVGLKEESAVVKEERCEGQESNNTSEDDSFR
jgi:hypothetical protein